MTCPPGQLALFELDAGDSAGPTSDDPAPAAPASAPMARPAEAAVASDVVAVLAGLLGELTKEPPTAPAPDLRRARDEWLRRLQAARRSESAITAYRIAIDDLLAWCGNRGRSVFEEATIVDYLG